MFSFLCPVLRTRWSFTRVISQKRHEATARRMTKRLRIKPAKSLDSVVAPDKRQDHIVFNPPPSTPSPYQTPLIFLPARDPRRRLLAQSDAHNNPYRDPQTTMPPLSRSVQQDKRYHLTPADIEEIRRLRAEDPVKWNRNAVAQKFDCSPFFVGLVSNAAPAKRDVEKAKLEAVKANWGPRTTQARRDRRTRRGAWLRDE